MCLLLEDAVSLAGWKDVLARHWPTAPFLGFESRMQWVCSIGDIRESKNKRKRGGEVVIQILLVTRGGKWEVEDGEGAERPA